MNARDNTRDPLHNETRLPPAVTFATGAELLMRLGIVRHITRQGVRYIAEHHPEWPFGVDRPHPYGRAHTALLMATEPFLEFFRQHPPLGRGPDPRPRESEEDES